ncbi:hypothetical protein [Glutamicibacter sp. NPDC087344]
MNDAQLATFPRMAADVIALLNQVQEPPVPADCADGAITLREWRSLGL